MDFDFPAEFFIPPLLMFGSLTSDPKEAERQAQKVIHSADWQQIRLTRGCCDGLFYLIGGGSVILQSPTSNSMQLLGLRAGINSDLMCGNFDIKATIGNQLNGLTSGFKDLMGNVIQGEVTSMPAMVIQRASPGLYDMITNGVVQAGLSFDRSKLSCENLSKKLADYTMGDLDGFGGRG